MAKYLCNSAFLFLSLLSKPFYDRNRAVWASYSQLEESDFSKLLSCDLKEGNSDFLRLSFAEARGNSWSILAKKVFNSIWVRKNNIHYSLNAFEYKNVYPAIRNLC